MPSLPTADPAQFVQGAPVLHVPDVAATVAFYRDVLGFTCDYGDERYAVVWRDNSAIHLLQGRGVPAGLHLFQWVRDVDGYHRELAARGVRVPGPTDQPHGLREFAIEDPNGVRIVFGQDIEPD